MAAPPPGKAGHVNQASTVWQATTRSDAATIALAITAIATVLRLLLDSQPIDDIAWVAMGVFYLLTVGGTARITKIVLAVALLAGVHAYFTDPEAMAHLSEGLDRAAFLAALFAAMGFLEEAARRAPAVRATLAWIMAQTEKRRLAAAHGAGHLFGMVLSYGALSVVGGLMSDDLRHRLADDKITGQQMHSRRSGLLRQMQIGFATTNAWAPFAVSMVVVLSMVPEISWPGLLPYGIAIIAIGAALSLIGAHVEVEAEGAAGRATGAGTARADHAASASAGPVLPVGPGRGIATVVGIVAGLFLAALVVSKTLGVPIIYCVVIVAPPISVLWLLHQYRGRTIWPVLATARRVLDHARRRFPKHANVAIMLGSAGFIGSVVDFRITPEESQWFVDAVAGATWLLPVFLVWCFLGLCALGANGTLSGSLLAGAVADLHIHGVEPVALGVALTGIWGFGALVSPISASNIIVAQIEAKSPLALRRRTLTTVLAAGVAVSVLAALAH